MSVAGVAIVAADLDDPRVGTLLAEHLAEMEPTAPPESRHALTAEQFRMPGVLLWVAERENDSAAPLLGSVALKDVSPGHLEIKTMRVTASGRGLGLGRRLLDHALAQARLLGATAAHAEVQMARRYCCVRSEVLRADRGLALTPVFSVTMYRVVSNAE